MRTARLLVLALLAVAPVARAGDDAEAMRKASALWREVFGPGRQPSILARNELFKEAGLSYQGSLTVPLQGSYSCRSESQLRVLSGMLAFDASYAVMFGRRKEFFDTVQFLTSDIGQRVDGIDALPLPVAVRGLRKALAEDFSNEETLKSYADQGRKQLGILVEKAATDPLAMTMLMDYWYGWSVQGLYVASSLAQTAEGGDELARLFNRQMQNSQQLEKLYSALEGTQLGKRVSQPDRSSLFRAVSQLIQSKQGAMGRKDFRTLLGLVQGPRSELVRPCTK